MLAQLQATLQRDPDRLKTGLQRWHASIAARAEQLGLGDRVARELGLDSPSVAADPNLAVWKAWFGLS